MGTAGHPDADSARPNPRRKGIRVRISGCTSELAGNGRKVLRTNERMAVNR
jgi:hypothetical protein